MYKTALLCIGPALMIFIGLHLFHSVPVTFMLFYGWLLLIPVISYIQNKKKPHIFKKYSLSWKVIMIGLISGIICLFTIYGLASILLNTIFDLVILRQLLEDWGFNGSYILGLIFVLIFINPVLEELYWREFMHQRLIVEIGPFPTIFMTSFFYSLYHLLSLMPMFNWPFNLIAVLPVFIAGFLWGYFRYKLKSIAASIICHTLADSGIVLVYLSYIME
ncbi:CPBP family intramembrane glutamic endopeptidase [Metabacillus arenae]|uniref:CPBP family intramembrane metalloprotease n=1 Tax=Metabacillus arenae TaxID=2771434 RepID=A0A926NGV1_9BACI|nr:type II CAAX endopeptidase family protein [Metabacillus arenae]MBD1381041.1 CPBP family intramembrane metalloprotease [Metabacillus arenae]